MSWGYLFKAKSTIKTLEKSHWCRSGVFIVNFEHISNLFLMFLLLTLGIIFFCWETILVISNAFAQFIKFVEKRWPFRSNKILSSWLSFGNIAFHISVVKQTICKWMTEIFSHTDNIYRQYERCSIHLLTLKVIKMIVVSGLMRTLIYQKLASIVCHKIQGWMAALLKDLL